LTVGTPENRTPGRPVARLVGGRRGCERRWQGRCPARDLRSADEDSGGIPGTPGEGHQRTPRGQFTTAVLNATYAIQVVGAAVLAYGLVRLDVVDTVAGLVILQTAKAWYIDRQVLLFEDMKDRHPEYARWEY
jgi:hypothetical protein